MNRTIKIKLHGILSLIFLSMVLLGTSLTTQVFAQSGSENSGRIEANGIPYYYEIQGAGEPLLLLHGGLGSLDMFRPILPSFTKSRKVILVDLHGHGRTELGDRKINLVDIGNDLAVILKELEIDQVDVMGYSLGAGAGFQLAVQHPQLVGKLVLVSGGYSSDAFFPEIKAQQSQVNAQAAEMMKETPMYQSYVEVAPHPDEFPALLDAIGEAMSVSYDWSSEVKTLKMPVLLIYGDSDMFRPEHMIEFYKLLGGGLKDAGWMGEHMSQNRLAILPGLTHYNIFMSPVMANTALAFLNGEQ